MPVLNNQGDAWEREYKNPKLVTKGDKPQADTLRFFKYLKKEKKLNLENKIILDLGCGTGRNSNYLADLGNQVIGMEISKTALIIAEKRAKELSVQVDYRLADIGSRYDIEDSSIDVVLDVTSSNSLDEKGRDIYLKETHRVLKAGGYFFVRALSKEGNKNVKNLLKQSPGKEKETYFLKELGLTERVFSREDFVSMYGKYFKILKLERKSGYTTMGDRIYKRDYILSYMQK